MQVQLPQQGSRSILPQANHILRRMWKLKEIPPLIKTFTWRLIRRALATRQRAGRYSPNIDKLCTACGSLQTDAHLFFHCDFARAVWFLADPPLCTHCLPEEEDGVQNILSSFISDSTSNFLFQKILIILWYLWKARNDQRFQRRIWTPWQVQHALAAHIATHNAALFATQHDLQQEDVNQPTQAIKTATAGTTTPSDCAHSCMPSSSCLGQTPTTNEPGTSGMNEYFTGYHPRGTQVYSYSAMVDNTLIRPSTDDAGSSGINNSAAGCTAISMDRYTIHCFKASDAMLMHPLCLIILQFHRERLELASSLSTIRCSLRKLSTSRRS